MEKFCIESALLSDPDFAPEQPFSRLDALLWLMLNADEDGFIALSIGDLAGIFGWSKSRVHRFQRIVLRGGYFEVVTNARVKRSNHSQSRRKPEKILRVRNDRNDTRNVPPYVYINNNLSAGGVPPKGHTPPASGKGSLENLDKPNLELQSGEKSKTPPKTTNAAAAALPLDETPNLVFDGDHVKVTHREFEELKKTYPGQNTMSVIRLADKKFPYRKNKRASAGEYLEMTFSWRDRDLRSGESITQKKDRAYDFWRDEAEHLIKQGIWNEHLNGPPPWAPDTECPKGRFTALELNTLRQEFEDVVARDRVKRERDNAEFHARWQSQNAVPEVFPLEEARKS